MVTSAVAELTPGVYVVTTGPGPLGSNVYLVRSGDSWVLIDTGWPGGGPAIASAAAAVFGTAPVAILLSHVHPDHSGSVRELVRTWSVPVYATPEELPFTAGRLSPRYGNPLDRWLLGPVLAALPERTRARMYQRTCLDDVVQAFDPDGEVPFLPEWTCVRTPGHTPGHVAFHRPRDGLLVTGDAVLGVNLNSVSGLRPGPATRLYGPPYYTTWDWRAATDSIATLARLAPSIVAPGHGPALTHDAAAALRALAGTAAGGRPRLTEGLFRPVDYAGRAGYRPTPALYQRLQPLGVQLVRWGAAPRDAVVLEVPGRRSGVIHQTILVRLVQDGVGYLVSLAGESQWARNVRANGGKAVLGRSERRSVTLAEVPAERRPAILRAYLNRTGRAREARHYFGVRPDASDEELRVVAERYPVFRVLTGPGEAANAPV
jgi:glyoxylase-like metal-dependent hydrolase (beta-lactamase superfamily II)